jgi:acetylornithine deacetylase/succinyl-diaminopimelate desuccinylase-like protein
MYGKIYSEPFPLTNFIGSILVAHSDHEHVSVADLEEAVKGYKKLIEHSLK